MEIQAYPRIAARSPEITDVDVKSAVTGALRSRARDTDPVQWVGVGMDAQGRLLEFIAVELGSGDWLVFHAMLATRKVLLEIGLGEMTEMGDYTAANGSRFTEEDLERWATEAESGQGYVGGHLGPATPGRPVSVGASARPFSLRLDAARRAKLDEVARQRHTTPSQLVRDLIDTL